jgi:hypothetical protein
VEIRVINKTVTSTHDADCTSPLTENSSRQESSGSVEKSSQSGAVINNKEKPLVEA